MGAAVGHSFHLMLMKLQWTFLCICKLISCLGSFKRFPKEDLQASLEYYGKNLAEIIYQQDNDP